jgi:hypothetical protein
MIRLCCFQELLPLFSLILSVTESINTFVHLMWEGYVSAESYLFCFVLFCVESVDLMRARLASEVCTRAYRNLIHGLIEMYRKEGFLSWFKGMSPTLYASPLSLLSVEFIIIGFCAFIHPS